MTFPQPQRDGWSFLRGGILGMLLLSASSACGQQDAFGKPLDAGWWHLSLEEIRAGDSIETSAGSENPQVAPRLRLEDYVRIKHGRDLGSDFLLRKDFDIEEYIKSQNQPMTATRRTAPEDGSSEASTDTTLRDYTKATVNALRKSPVLSTNLFRAMSPLRPMRTMDFGIYNREQPGDAGAEGDAAAAQTYSLPGPSSYGVPANPLEVVQSSFGDVGFRPVLPSPLLDLTPAIDTSVAAPEDNGLKSATDLPPALPHPAQTETNGVLPIAKQDKTPATTKVPQIVQPVGPQPVVPRTGGPNASGFYEPKSISDLKMGR